MLSSKLIIWLIIILIIIIAIFGVFYFGFQQKKESRALEPLINSIIIEKPNIVVRGQALARVKIYATLAETETDSPEVLLLGEAKLELADPAGELWLWSIPSEPFLITGIYAQGYDQSGNLVGRVNLNVNGSTALYNALWSSGRSILLPLKVGQVGTFEKLSLKVEKVREDSRCPIGSQCVWAGDVVVETRLSLSTEEDTAIIKLSDETYSFGDFFIDIVAVWPLPKVGIPIEPSDYLITFSVSENIKP